MRKPFLSKIRKALEEEHTEIIRKLSNSDTNIDIGSDETDHIQAIILSNTQSSLINHDKNKLIKIENALKKIADGTFGYCEECGDEIAEKRLLVNPGFNTCIICAEQLELINRRTGK
jgi:RNA polymerase-binding protein DksA